MRLYINSLLNSMLIKHTSQEEHKKNIVVPSPTVAELSSIDTELMMDSTSADKRGGCPDVDGSDDGRACCCAVVDWGRERVPPGPSTEAPIDTVGVDP